MVYCRKIVILNGVGAHMGARGILTLERTLRGVKAVLNLYHFRASDAALVLKPEGQSAVVATVDADQKNAEIWFSEETAIEEGLCCCVLSSGEIAAYGSNRGIKIVDSGLMSVASRLKFKSGTGQRRDKEYTADGERLQPLSQTEQTDRDGTGIRVTSVETDQTMRTLDGAFPVRPVRAVDADINDRQALDTAQVHEPSHEQAAAPMSQSPYGQPAASMSQPPHGATAIRDAAKEVDSIEQAAFMSQPPHGATAMRDVAKEVGSIEQATQTDSHTVAAVTDADMDSFASQVGLDSVQTSGDDTACEGASIETAREVSALREDAMGQFMHPQGNAEQEHSVATGEFVDDAVSVSDFYPTEVSRFVRTSQGGKEAAAALDSAAVWGGYHRIVPQERSREQSNHRRQIPAYYAKIRQDIERLFRYGAADAELNRSLRGTRWVRVEVRNGMYYCVGLVGGDAEYPEYIAYAVPGQYSYNPPRELASSCQWLPYSVAAPRGRGYWIVYQDAETGKKVKLNMKM